MGVLCVMNALLGKWHLFKGGKIGWSNFSRDSSPVSSVHLPHIAVLKLKCSGIKSVLQYWLVKRLYKQSALENGRTSAKGCAEWVINICVELINSTGWFEFLKRPCISGKTSAGSAVTAESMENPRREAYAYTLFALSELNANNHNAGHTVGQWSTLTHCTTWYAGMLAFPHRWRRCSFSLPYNEITVHVCVNVT